MATQSIAEELASYASNLTYANIDDKTKRAAKTRIIDTIVCGIGASHAAEPTIERVIDFSSRQASDGAVPIMGSEQRAPLEYAVFANASLVRYLDWNDSYLHWNDAYNSPSAGHPSSNIGALLPVICEADGDGQDLLVSTVLAYEIYCRLVDETALHIDGLDHVTLGLVSCTLAIGKALKLSTRELTQAVNIALSSYIGLWQTRTGELTEWKGLAFGNTARNAVIAVKLVQGGIAGPESVFEGDAGFSNLLEHPVIPDVDTFGGNRGTYRINNTVIKSHPVCGGIQDAIDAIFTLQNGHDFGWQEIEQIQLGVSKHTIDVCVDEKWTPQNRNTADHSLPYCVARALIDREMGPKQFGTEKISDQRVSELMDRMEITEHSDSFALQIETTGDSFEHTIRADADNPAEPTMDEVRRKAGIAVGECLTNDRIDEIFAWISSLETKSSVSELFKLLEIR